MLKKKIFKIEDSNIEGLGSEADKKCRETAAATEKAWKKVKQNQAGFYCWRIEKFKVKENLDGLTGVLYNDDSYIFLNGVENKETKKLNWDIHFWLGETTTQDEYGTAAYKTVELDDFMGGDPVQHRECSGFESPQFLKFFPNGIRLLTGGVESGFNHVEPESYVPRLMWIKGRSNVRFQEVDIKVSSLNSGDAFLLDTGLNLYQYFGRDVGRQEKFQCGKLAQALDDERKGKPERYTFSQDDDADEIMGQFFSYFQDDLNSDDFKVGVDIGTEKVEELIGLIPQDGGGCDAAWEMDDKKVLMVLSDSSGEMKFTEVAKGTSIKKNLLSSDDVNILDTGAEVFVHIGKNASTDEKAHGMRYASQYLTSYDRPPALPITQIYEGGENEVFENAFSANKSSSSSSSSSSVSDGPVSKLKNAGDWAIFNSKVIFEKSGTGLDELKDELPSDGCVFAVIHISATNFGNTGGDIVNNQNIILKWLGPNAKAMKKVKHNGKLDKALKKLQPNNGYLETLGKNALTLENIVDRIRPGSGSKVIEADE